MALVLLACTLTFAQRRRESAAAVDPNVLAAESYLRQRNYVKAIEALELSLNVSPPGRPELFEMLASACLSSGDKMGALGAFERGIAAHPSSTKLKELYISPLPIALSREAVREKLEGALKKANSPIFQKAIGQLLLAENPLNARAGQLLSSAVSSLPRDPEALYFYGQWACLNGREALCVTELIKALALAPHNDEAHMQIYTLIGVAEDELNHAALAERAFKNALRFNQKLQTKNPQAAFQYAKFLIKRSRGVKRKS
ncbi:MAG: hypothetical protein WKF84_10070 [Pyrinomonadaceae bacterium]